MALRRSVNATATGTLVTGSGTVSGAVLCAAGDAATAVLRSGGAGGTIICKLGAGIGLSAQWSAAPDEVLFSADLHVTITGTTPQFSALV